jgi:hypothetical protein
MDFQKQHPGFIPLRRVLILGKKWYGYVEAFGAVSKGSPPQHAVDGGLACYFSENTKLDFSTGFGLSKAATDWYAAIGISFRFATKRK